MNDDIIETLDDSQVEEIPPTPVAPEAPQPNFTEAEAGGSSDYASETAYTNSASSDDDTAKVLAIISLVCGILSLICCCIACANAILSVAAIVCGIISIKKSDSYKGMAIAGIACGGVGIVLRIVMVILAGFVGAIGDLFDSINGIDFDEFF